MNDIPLSGDHTNRFTRKEIKEKGKHGEHKRVHNSTGLDITRVINKKGRTPLYSMAY